MSAECIWVKGHLAALLDEELSAEERGRAERHLASCAACRAALERLRELEEIDREALWQAEFGDPAGDAADPHIPAGSKRSPAGRTEDSADALMRAVRSRFDFAEAKRLRQRERETASETAGAPDAVSYLTGEEVADLPLEESLHRRRAAARAQTPADRASAADPAGERRGRLKRFADFWLSPSPRTRWLQLAGGTAAVATLAVLLLAHDPDQARETIRQSVRVDSPTELDAADGGGGAAGAGAAALTEAADRAESVRETHVASNRSVPPAEKREARVPEAVSQEARTRKARANEAFGADSPDAAPTGAATAGVDTRGADELGAAAAGFDTRAADERGAGLHGADALGADAPGWHHALENLLRVLDRPRSGGARLEAMTLEAELLAAEETLAARMAVSDAQAWVADDADRHTARDAGELTRMLSADRADAAGAGSSRGRTPSRSGPEPSAEAERPDQRVAEGGPLPAAVQNAVGETALPETEEDAEAYWAVAEGWYALWRTDVVSQERARHAARYYGALHLATLERGLALGEERRGALSERLGELDAALSGESGRPPAAPPVADPR